MKNKNFLTRAWVALLAVLLLIPVISCTFLTASAVDLNKEGSVTIVMEAPETGNSLSGAVIELYRVAEAKSENNMLSFVLIEAFAGSGVSLKDLEAAGLAQKLADFAAAKSDLKKATGTTDIEGILCFSGLKAGIYLVVQKGSVEGYYPFTPFLISLPLTSEDGTGWIYDVSAAPKMELLPKEPTTLTVKKAWIDNDSKNRPTSVTVQLLNDKKVVETITLSGENSWTYTWDDLDAAGKWSVQEINIPKNYKVSYSANGTVITITNATSLLQTGQLNWPVPVLAVAGVLLFAFGWVMTRKNEENEA